MKLLVYLAIGVGGLIGGYLPTLVTHGQNMILASIVGSGIGGAFGLYFAYKLLQYFDY